jgi:hypothetical protein
MPKLTTRQILILGAMLLAILYGAYDLFFSAPNKPAVVATVKTGADLNAFIGDIAATLTKDPPSQVVAYTINRAEMEWLRDPFYEPKSNREEIFAKEIARIQEASAAVKGQLSYTGYVDMGHKKIAVVNGNECVVGDGLGIGGYMLNSIYPDKIIIYNKETRMMLDIPLQE